MALVTISTRRRKGESEKEKNKRIAEVDAMMDEHEGFHKMVIYYKGVPRMLPTDENGDWEPHRKMKKKTVYECYETFTREELKELISAGFVKVEELR